MRQSKNATLAPVLMPEIVRSFAGREIGNAELKAWLCKKFPDAFPTGRADSFVEFVANVDFATTSGGRGYGCLKGILRDKHGNLVPEGTKGASRSWVVPEDTVLRSKLEIYMEEGTIGAAAKTKLRRAPTIDQYVAAKKEKEQGE